MGILNLTPDSFSDGGCFIDEALAVGHAVRMVEEGADIIDVGGESTRPGSARVDAAEQIRRVCGVIRRLREVLPGHIIISIDTLLAEVADAALDAGATLINDVSAGSWDPGMFPLAARRGADIVLMHMRERPETMQENPSYGDVVAEVRDYLLQRAVLAQAAGIARERILIDPGIGFGKTKEHNLQLLAHLNRFVATGYAVLLGASRKRFMGSICAETEPRKLVGATCATTVLGVMAGVRVFRVHDVCENRQAVDVSWAVSRPNLVEG
jgi:dihydropteroate synthase